MNQILKSILLAFGHYLIAGLLLYAVSFAAKY
jgi:hypothetical protein